MIQRTGQSVTFEAFFTASKIGKTGITVTVDVYNPAGSLIVTAGSAAETGGGLYRYTLAGGSTGTGGAYRAIFKTADETVDLQHVPSLWEVGVAGVDNLDATVSSRNAVAPDNGGVATINTTVNAIKTKTDVLPGDPASNAQVLTRMAAAAYTAPDNAGIANAAAASATAAAQATAANAAAGFIKGVTDKLATMLEAATAGNFRFTAAGLANAPSGGGGTGGLTVEQDEILRDMCAKLVGDADRLTDGDVYQDREGTPRLKVAFPTSTSRRVTDL